MKRDDALYGAHSAIQKAVRRGDLDLAKTSFDLMWPEKEHRNWLKWRMTSIVQEDSLGMVGEMPDFYKRVKGLSPEEEEKEWRKMVYRVTVAPANKDSGGLYDLGRKGLKPVEHAELEDTLNWFRRMDQAGGSPGDVVVDLFDELVGRRDFSDYEKNALRLMRWRAGAGGMMGDKQMSLCGMIIVAHRGIDPDVVQTKLDEGLTRWKQEYGRTTLKRVPLPWYAFDMHTQVGKIALASHARKSGMDKTELDDLWFCAESAYIPTWHCQWSRVVDSPTVFDSMWWPLAVRDALGGQKAKQNLNMWRTETANAIKGLVEWLIQKRESESDDRS